MNRNYDVTILFPITVIFLRKLRVAKFADIIKIQLCLLTEPLKTQKMLKDLEIMHLNAI